MVVRSRAISPKPCASIGQATSSYVPITLQSEYVSRHRGDSSASVDIAQTSKDLATASDLLT
jgi:hypothetical protein